MSSTYSHAAKAHALDLLHEHDNNVPYVSHLTGISERTLYTWRKQLKYQLQDQSLNPQPKHWLSQQPEHQDRLQQQNEKPPLQQQQHMTVFGMTQAELEEALKVEYIPSFYTDLHADLRLHLQHLNASLTDDPETAHVKALAFSRLLADALKLEELIRLEKPQLNLFKYEYPDKTYHDIPFWSNAVHSRASEAYDEVVVEAKRQYEEQQAASTPYANTPSEDELLLGNPDGTPTDPSTNHESSVDNPDGASSDPTPTAASSFDARLNELIYAPYSPDDFIPKHTGYHKYFFGEDPYTRFNNPDTDEDPYTRFSNPDIDLDSADSDEFP